MYYCIVSLVFYQPYTDNFIAVSTSIIVYDGIMALGSYVGWTEHNRIIGSTVAPDGVS